MVTHQFLLYNKMKKNNYHQKNPELMSGNFYKGQKEFRKKYRDGLKGWYNGFVHLAMIFLIGFSSLYYFTSHISNVKWMEWLIVPITLIGSNLFEWWIHRFVMHKPRLFPGAKAIYSRHTLQHHQFFTEHEMRFAGPHDWRVTLFPPYALAVFIAVLSALRFIFETDCAICAAAAPTEFSIDFASPTNAPSLA